MRRPHEPLLLFDGDSLELVVPELLDDDEDLEHDGDRLCDWNAFEPAEWRRLWAADDDDLE